MFRNLSKRSQAIVAGKVRSITEDIYATVESLTLTDFGAIIAMLIEDWCKGHDVDVLDFMGLMEDVMLELVEKDKNSKN